MGVVSLGAFFKDYMMPTRYSEVIQDIDPRGKFFKSVKESELTKLKDFGFPESLLEFYRYHSPFKIIESDTEEPIRIYPALGIIDENRNCIPGCDISPKGFVVFATTVYGDAYCFDLNANKIDPPVLLVGHEIMYEGCSENEIRESGVAVADNLLQFLERFRNNELIIDPYHE